MDSTDANGGMAATAVETVGAVSVDRYQELVARILQIDEQLTLGQFEIGDAALEIEPMNSHGGGHADNPLLTVRASMERLSEDTRIPVNTLETRRWVSSRWPKAYRIPGISYGIYSILASMPDDEQRWATITKPPEHDPAGRGEWTEDAAKRAVGHKVNHPVTVLEKVRAIHDLAQDEQVAATVATDLLRRPNVAFKAVSDPVARDAVNRAQVDRSRQLWERNIPPAAERALEQIEQKEEYLDLIVACSTFTAAIGRAIPQLRGLQFSELELAALRQQIAKARATVDWLDSAVETGNLTLDEGLAALLRGE